MSSKKIFGKNDFSSNSGKNEKISFLPFFPKMIFLTIFHRILVKKNHFGHFGQVSGVCDTSDPRVTCISINHWLNLPGHYDPKRLLISAYATRNHTKHIFIIKRLKRFSFGLLYLSIVHTPLSINEHPMYTNPKS